MTSSKQEQLLEFSFSKTMTLNEALKSAGGFGLFQYLMFTFFCFSFWCGGIVVYIIHFMEAQPAYVCSNSPDFPRGKTFKCSPIDFCQPSSRVYYKVDWSNPESIKNYVTDFHLECIGKVEMGLMGTVIFIGYTLSCLVLPRLADIKGRKFVFCGFYHFQVLGIAAILFLPSLYSIYLGLFMVGFAQGIRSSVGYVYALEFIETSK